MNIGGISSNLFSPELTRALDTVSSSLAAGNMPDPNAFLSQISGSDPAATASSSTPSVTGVPPIDGLTNPTAGIHSLGEGRTVTPEFASILGDFLGQVDAAQHRADSAVESLAVGEPIDVHQVMLALNEASNAMQLTLQVRGKVLEAYQDLMRMPL